MEKIDRLSLFILNKVRLIRLINGKSAYQISLELGRSSNYVNNIESSSQSNKYNSADYPLLAEIFNCSISDILPPNDWPKSSSHEKVEKYVKSMVDENFVEQILMGIKESAHSNILLDEKALLKHLNVVNDEEKKVVRLVLNRIEK
ncbi:hypothetical protein [Sphingobacterium deserti]|uniref:Uncharacterized protein n=1 Tax=Sphingobacterium deserti TaxID=1229276 RepID=A0A0B8T1A7_9SPHI|nr:hypothetical protein [Sphingobacterium deserti]KGE12458.1 hypothetical protein DI53_3723 [Sphingobacterium deserti]